MSNHQKALAIIERLDGIYFQNDFLCGKINLFTQDLSADFQVLEEDYLEAFTCNSVNKIGDYPSAVGKEVFIQLKNRNRLFYESFTTLFDAPANWESFPGDGFYLHELNRIVRKDSEEPIIKCYLTILNLNKVLRVICDDARLQVYVFLGTRKVELNIRFSKNDLEDFNKNLSCDKAVHLIGLLNDERYIDEKKEIFKSRLIKFAESSNHSNLYQEFLSDFNMFYGNFIADYQLFTQSFSIDSLRNKLLEEKNNYKRRINDILTSIQGRIIALPIASMLTISQMKVDIPLVNVAMFFGVVIIAGISIVSLILQFLNLCYINEEKNDLNVKLSEYDASKSEIDKVMNNIKSRVLWHKLAIIAIFIGIIVIIVVTAMFVTQFSPGAFAKVFDIIASFFKYPNTV